MLIFLWGLLVGDKLISLKKALELRKAKYVKRWRGKDGQWQYSYSLA